MNCACLLPIAQGLVRTTFEWGRIQSNADWVLPVGALLAIALFVRWMYRRDAIDWHPALGWFLAVLRTLVLLGLLVLYLQPQWRTERELVRNSQVVLLVDTSLSMGLSDTESATAGAAPSRAGQVAAALDDSDLLDTLRRTHDVTVLQFNEGLDRDRIVTLRKIATRDKPAGTQSEAPKDSGEEETEETDNRRVDWNELLKPRGRETRLGQALRQVISDHSGGPLSGIVLLSDGGQNAGIAPQAAVKLAQDEKLPVHTVGIGSDKLPANVRVSDLVVPARAYPGDDYTVTGFLQAQRMAGKVVEVQLLSRAAAAAVSESAGGQIEDRQQVTLGGDGEVVPVRFELTPEKPGRRTLCFRVRPPPGDADGKDDFREADIEIVDRKNRVLMLAGGPMREYRFLRTLLYRDRSTTIDVLLQSARPGVSQEADKLLDDFPITREEMFEYDCLIAFDPDWQALSTEQIDLLETWVAEQGGGLIVVAGPVYTGQTIGGWIEDRRMTKLRALYPVEFHRRFSALADGMTTSNEPWPLEFSREGLEAAYLWPAESATAGRQAWAAFEGVFSYCPVRGPKPGATVLARFSDPRAGQGDQAPVFLAGQFYGSGRVFYIGSGELWRIRKLDDTYFEKIYTKLIRHVSQGRLLRGSSRGVLLVARDRYLLGDTVEVRARLTNARLEPLDAAEVALQVVLPDATAQTVVLKPDPGRAGTYTGRFPVLQEGSYQLELPVPESRDERLARRIQVNVPDLERENPARNDALLSRIAKRTSNRQEAIEAEYYVGIDELLNPPSPKRPVTELLKDRTKTIIVPDAPDPLWEETWMRWMMYTLCGLLCLEWLIRRLFKMA